MFHLPLRIWRLDYLCWALSVIGLSPWYAKDGFAQTGVPVPEMADVDETVSNFMRHWSVPGGSVAIVKEGRLVYARGFGYADREADETVQPHHLFRVASLSKPITSVAIMKLIDQAQIELDDKIFGMNGILSGSDYRTMLDSRVEDITVRHLLNHTSGWGFLEGDIDPMFFNQHIAEQLTLQPPVGPIPIIRFMLKTQVLDSDPGNRFFYSNFGYCILGRVIEQVSGVSYEDYIKREILTPLGISAMQLGKNLYQDRAPDEVTYYDYPGSLLTGSVYDANVKVSWPYGGFNIEAMDAHGGWIASPTDLLRLFVAIDGIETKPDILSESSIELMSTPSSANQNYGLGWEVNSWNNWWHMGSLPGSSSIMVRTYDGLGWAVLFNTRPSDWRAFLLSMDRMVWEAIGTVSVFLQGDLGVGQHRPGANTEPLSTVAAVIGHGLAVGTLGYPAAAAAVRAVDFLAPSYFFEPAFRGGVVGELFEQLHQGDAFSVVPSRPFREKASAGPGPAAQESVPSFHGLLSVENGERVHFFKHPRSSRSMPPAG